MDVSILNVSNEEFWVEDIDAPEFNYRPVGGIMVPGKQATSGAVMRKAPTFVTVVVRGRAPERVDVPALPADAGGTAELVIVYARSKRWTSRWEIARPGDTYRINPRFIPEDSNPSFVAHRQLLDAAERGDVGEVDRLLESGAPLRWDTTAEDPLSVAALGGKNAVIERLLLLDENAFSIEEIDSAVAFAALGNNDDVSTLRLLIERLGSRVTEKGRADALRNAAQSNQFEPNSLRIKPAGPAIRYLIDEAKFDVNTPVSEAGHTVLDLAEGAPLEAHRDPELAAFLRTRGARRGELKIENP